MNNFAEVFFNFDEMLQAFPRLFTVGLPNTLILAGGGFLGALIIGLLLAVMLVSPYAWVRFPARVYVDLWRGLPAILSVMIIGLGLPLAGFSPFGRDPYAYAILALAVINGGFVAEIFRSGIQSVEAGQMEAARSLGLSYPRAMAKVVVPQGLRRVLPALMNQFIICFKESALVYLLGLVAWKQDLFSIGHSASAVTGTYSVIMAAAFMYLCVTVPMTHLVNHWDQRMRSNTGRGSTKNAKRKTRKAPPVPSGSLSPGDG